LRAEKERGYKGEVFRRILGKKLERRSLKKALVGKPLKILFIL